MRIGAEIGGFLPLDLRHGVALHSGALGFNTARSALRSLLTYIAANRQVERLWLPAFNCPLVEDMLKAAFPDLRLAYYNIGEDLEPVNLIGTGLFYAYNVFGLKSAFTRSFPAGTILDNVHAFYTRPQPGHHTFYSARKFFGVPDGAYLYSDLPLAAPPISEPAWERAAFLLKRLDAGSQASYADFLASEAALTGAGVTAMSALAAHLLCAIDYEDARRRRLENFRMLHGSLAGVNALGTAIGQAVRDAEFVPFSYPLLREDGAGLRCRLIERGVFVPALWEPVGTSAYASDFEKRLAADVVHLPVDQRYGAREMEYILTQLA